MSKHKEFLSDATEELAVIADDAVIIMRLSPVATKYAIDNAGKEEWDQDAVSDYGIVVTGTHNAVPIELSIRAARELALCLLMLAEKAEIRREVWLAEGRK